MTDVVTEAVSSIPPQGTVTFMFTDIVGSTALRAVLVRELGEVDGDKSYRELILDPHNDRIRHLIDVRHGFVVKTVGDAFIASFGTAIEGVRCAADIQRSLHEHPIPTTKGPLSVRIGVHTGQATLIRDDRGWDYDGHALNIAARIESLLVGGGQILCSGATCTVAGYLPGIRYHPCGSYRPKGLGEPVDVFELLWREEQIPHPPATSTTGVAAANVSIDGAVLANLAISHGFENIDVRTEENWATLSATLRGRRFLALVLRDARALAAILNTMESPLDVIVGVEPIDLSELGGGADAPDPDRFANCVFLSDLTQLAQHLGLRSILRLQHDSLFDSRFNADHFEEPVISQRLDAESGVLAIAYLFRWLAGQRSPLLAILADYGGGKSFLSRSFVLEMENVYAAGGDIPLPFYVDLASVPSPGETLTSDNILRARLRQIGADENAVSVLTRSVRAGQIAVVFDGFDERAIHLSSEEQARFLSELRSLVTSRSKLVLTSRTHLFTAAEERLQLSSNATAVYLLPFDRIRIEGAFRKILGQDTAEALQLVDQVYNLSQLASRPVLLTMIAGAFGRLRELVAQGRMVGVSDVYEQFVGEWLDRDIARHGVITRRERLLSMSALARDLWQREASGEQNPGIDGESVPDWLESRVDARVDLQAAGRQIRTASFLTRDAKGAYRFAHRSFLEFFLARGIAEALVAGDAVSLDIPRLSPETIAFTVDIARHGPRSGASTLERALARYEPGVSENAVRLAVAWKRADPPSSPSTAGAHLERASLVAEDLRGVDLRGAHLGGVDLFGADLTGAELTNADLHGADLRGIRAARAMMNGADLRRCRLSFSNLDSASLRGVTAIEAEALGTSFIRADVTEADFTRASLASARIISVTAATARMRDADVTRTIVAPRHSKIGMRGPRAAGHTDRITSLAFGPDGTTLVSGSWDKTVRTWDAATGRPLQIFTGHANWVSGVAFAADGRIVASAGSADSTLRLWRADGERVRTTAAHPGTIFALAVSADGNTIATGGSEGRIRLWDARTGDPREILWGSKASPHAIAWAPDGHLIAAGCYDGYVRVWTPSGRLQCSFEAGNVAIASLAFASDSRTLAATTGKDAIGLWDGDSGKPLMTLRPSAMPASSPAATALAYSPDGRSIAVAFNDGVVWLLDPASNTVVGEPLRTGPVSAMSYAPDGWGLATASGTSITVWHPGTRRRLLTIQHSQDRLSATMVWARRAYETCGRLEGTFEDESVLDAMTYLDEDGRPWSLREVSIAAGLGQSFSFDAFDDRDR